MKNVDENKGKKIGYTGRRLRLGEEVKQFFFKTGVFGSFEGEESRG